MKWNRFAAFALVSLALVVPATGRGMGFCCPPRNPTLRELADEGDALVVGAVCQAHQDEQGDWTTEFHITRVLKSDSAFRNNKIVHLCGKFEQPANGTLQILVLVHEDEGLMGVLENWPAAPALIEHFRRIRTLDDRDPVGRLRYYFDHLQDTNEDVARDAHREFDRAEAADVMQAAKTLSPRKLRAWLTDPKTPVQRLSLYGLLLGHCGEARDAALLGRLARKRTPTDPTRAIDGLLTGYILLEPREGWSLLRRHLRDDSQHLLVRFINLRTVRFFHNEYPDRVPARDVIEAMALLLDQPDIADIAIEDFRRWRCWEMGERILALDARPSHDVPLMHRTILRYALQCPGAKAAALVAERRKKDPQQVADAEELLKFEAESQTKSVQ